VNARPFTVISKALSDWLTTVTVARAGRVVDVVLVVVAVVGLVEVTGGEVVVVLAGGAVDPIAFSTAAAALGIVVDVGVVGRRVVVLVACAGASGAVVVVDATSIVPGVRPAALTSPPSGPSSVKFMTPADTTAMINRNAVAHASQ